MSAALARIERDRFRDCERVIEHGLRTFRLVGMALAVIRDERLYRATHATFEAYCEERWNLSRPRAYQLIDAAELAEGLSTNVDTPALANEGQARELGRVPEEQRAEIWEQASERTEGKPTAKAIRQTWQAWQEREPEPSLPDRQDEAEEAATRFDERQEPSAAVTDYLASDETYQDKRYLAQFAKVLARCDDFMEFDAERVGRICNETDVTVLEQHLSGVEKFASKVRAARQGLRVIQGGAS